VAFYTYNGRDKEGKAVNGAVESPSLDSAVKLLRAKEIFVVSLKESKTQSGVADILARFKKVGYADVVNFTRQLATMIVAGLSLPDALRILRAQTTNPIFARLITDLEVHITGGGNLGDSLAKYPDVFSPIYVALVRAGE